jgi:maltooligosyltrehalose trehalohydrolase
MSAKLGWDEAVRGVHAEWLSFYRHLLSLRRDEIIPRLRGMQGNSRQYRVLGGGAVMVHWTLGDGSRLTLTANLSAEALGLAHQEKSGEIFSVGTIEGGTLGAWSVAWRLRSG